MVKKRRLLFYIRRCVPLGRKKAVRGVLAQERFNAIILREKARADRNQHPFSLLLFNTAIPETNSIGVQYLADVLAKRIRLTDEVGWFDNKCIGVLLPDTPSAGAKSLADDICKAITTKTSPPEYTVHTYPSTWFNNGNGHLAQLHFADSYLEHKITTSRALSVPTKDADGGKDMFGTHLTSTDTTLSCVALPQATERYLLYPLPAWKRAMDVIFALLGLVVLSPILLLVAIIVKTVSPGPVFFKQQRIGHWGKPFKMWKFRTMHSNADTYNHKNHVSQLINGEGSDKPMTKLDDDPRIIKFGKILRETCIDELPQLINVLMGEMSLVGPRPPLSYEVEKYSQWNYARFDAVPGITGLWQVSGKNRLTFFEMMRLDIQYLRKMSLWLDIIILLKTPLAIVSQIKDSLALQRKHTLVRQVMENA